MSHTFSFTDSVKAVWMYATALSEGMTASYTVQGGVYYVTVYGN